MNYSNAQRERKILEDLSFLLEAFESKKPYLANQGQALDGFSALANFLDISRRAQTLLEELK